MPSAFFAFEAIKKLSPLVLQSHFYLFDLHVLSIQNNSRLREIASLKKKKEVNIKINKGVRKTPALFMAIERKTKLLFFLKYVNANTVRWNCDGLIVFLQVPLYLILAL